MSQPSDGRPRHDSVVVGPWPGSTSHPPVGKPQRRFPGAMIPTRYRTKTGQRLLMECRNPKCRKPFDPNYPIPPGQLCADCRREEDERTPPLIPRDELEQRGPHSDG